MIAVVLNVVILVICAVVIARSPRHPWGYWVTLIGWVIGVLLVAGLATQLLGGTAGAAVFIASLVIGVVFVRPYLTRRR